MPCYDGREIEDNKRMKRHLDAFTAILCGLRGEGDQFNARAHQFADSWCRAHRNVDEMRRIDNAKRNKMSFQAYTRAQEAANAVLDLAYKTLCE